MKKQLLIMALLLLCGCSPRLNQSHLRGYLSNESRVRAQELGHFKNSQFSGWRQHGNRYRGKEN